ncbi:MAG: DNA polymerase III subunit beta [Spirochaetaceae bacterium]|jgi:DNA polymerase-3 subunit beta|nr:DNA polymerase III subunit beta [Spirochaetaceae bacterium]
MKFTCERSALLKEISIAQEIIQSKNAISILSNIYLEAQSGMLTIKSTDMKVYFDTKMPVSVEREGSTTVFGDKFLGYLNNIPDGEVEFDQSDSKIMIKPLNKKSKFQLKSIASDKFPEFPAVDAGDFFEMPVKNFKEMIKQTVFAVSDDETRYFMNGVFCEKQDDKIIMVGTDGRRLAYVEEAAGSGIKDFAGVIVPPKILNLVQKRAGDEGLIGISITDKQIFVRFGTYQLSSVLIEGQFPNYRRVIPESQAHVFTLSRADMIDALKRVALLVEQKSRRIYLGVGTGQVTISSEESELGIADEEIPCSYEGGEISIALNYQYLEEPFKAMEEDEASIHFSEPNRAITIKPVPERNFFHIVMPMQID